MQLIVDGELLMSIRRLSRPLTFYMDMNDDPIANSKSNTKILMA